MIRTRRQYVSFESALGLFEPVIICFVVGFVATALVAILQVVGLFSPATYNPAQKWVATALFEVRLATLAFERSS